MAEQKLSQPFLFSRESSQSNSLFKIANDSSPADGQGRNRVEKDT